MTIDLHLVGPGIKEILWLWYGVEGTGLGTGSKS